MSNQEQPSTPRKDQGGTNTPVPRVGEPLDGRHYLDVVEEQQYAGKPFIDKEQDAALGEGEKSPAQPETDRQGD